jgi:hypothetical protein
MKAIGHENKIESFGKPAAQPTDAGGMLAGSSHYQEPTPFCAAFAFGFLR